MEELHQRILEFIEYFNRTMAKPFKWTYKGRPLQGLNRWVVYTTKLLVHLGKSSTPVCGIIGATIAKPHRNTWR